MFKVKAGSEVQAIPAKHPVNGFLDPYSTVTKRDAYYEVEDIAIDPIKPGCAVKTVGYDLAKRGYYGFKLNSKKWQMMIVHSNDVEVM